MITWLCRRLWRAGWWLERRGWIRVGAIVGQAAVNLSDSGQRAASGTRTPQGTPKKSGK